MGLVEVGCEDGRWMELAQDHVEWRALVFVLAVNITGTEQAHFPRSVSPVMWFPVAGASGGSQSGHAHSGRPLHIQQLWFHLARPGRYGKSV